MGEAARRKTAANATRMRRHEWLATLSGDDAVVAEVALDVYEKIVLGYGLTHGCYLLAFFLHKYFLENFGIKVEVVVGWVNDGLWEGATSHAWVEYNGKKVDISLHRTSDSRLVPPGALTILDQAIEAGQAVYSYWRELPAANARYLQMKSQEEHQFAVIFKHKNLEHQRMLAYTAMVAGSDAYFAAAPSSSKYESLKELLGPKSGRL